MKWIASLALVLSLLAGTSQAATIYESSTLGAASLAGFSVSGDWFPGVRFQLVSSVQTTAIGGHFGVSDTGNHLLFGAVVALGDATDFPDSPILNTPDVLGTALLAPVVGSSSQVTAPLSLLLSPGWYALIYGSQLFGATGSGLAPDNGIDIGVPSYIRRNSVGGWVILNASGVRFVLEGREVATPVPEPATLLLLGTGLVAAGARRRMKKRG